MKRKYLKNVLNTLSTGIYLFEKSLNNRFLFSFWILIPPLAGFLIFLFFILKLYSCYKKRKTLNEHLIEYIKSVQNIQKPLEMLNEPLNDISVNTKLDDFQKDKIRAALWRINTMQNTLKNLQNLENDNEWQKNIKNINKNDLHKSGNGWNPTFIDPDDVYQSSLEPINENDQSFLERVFAVIRENYNDNTFNVDDLSKKMGMSRSSFYNRIKTISGQAPADFIRQYRMERAKEMLKLKQYTIAEIAYKTGFSDVKYFRDVFRKKYNKSPGQYSKTNGS